MNGFTNFVKTLGVGRIAMLAATLAGLAAFFIFLIFRLSAPGMAPLYGKLEANDAAAVVTKLDAMRVPYQLTGDGSVVLVPEDQVLRLRMTLAENGLPSGGSAGYELFDKQDAFSATTFTQNLNYMRALEGELARTIRSLSTIEAARVHLVLPKHELFAQDKAQPSASIVVRAKGGGLTRGQVKAIQNLVASAVEDLSPGRVSIVDEEGRLLASGSDGSNPEESTAALADERTNAFESRLRNDIEDIVARVVGPGRARVEVAAEMDFSRITKSDELYDPDSQVVRSSQTVEDKSSDQEGSGNDAVSVGNNLPDAQAPASEQGSTTQSAKNRTEETINYEISKTVKTEILEAGRVKRLSVAVLVDGTTSAPADGGDKTYTPRTQEDLDKISTLVRSAIGYNEKRGDQVTVVNLPFAAGEIPEPIVENAPLLGLEKGDYIRIGEIAALAIVSLLTILFVIRPLITRLTGISQASGLPATVPQMLPDGTVAHVPLMVGSSPVAALPQSALSQGIAALNAPGGMPAHASPVNQMIDLAQVEGQVKEGSVRKVGEIIAKHPEESIAILRNWLYQSD